METSGRRVRISREAQRSRFDRFAELTSRVASQASFFTIALRLKRHVDELRAAIRLEERA